MSERVSPWNNPALVTWTPVVAAVLLESANVWQLLQMWAKYTAAGQSLIGWISVNIALVLWCNYYRVIAPVENRKAFYATIVGVILNACVVATVVYFRLQGRG